MSILIRNLTEKGYVHNDLLIGAFSTIGREEFVPDALSHNAEVDIPLPIGYGQTIPQPTVVAFALELLGVAEGQNVLEVGCGSGWVTALIAYMVGKSGRVTGLEIIPDLHKYGKENIEKFDILRDRKIELYTLDGLLGYPKNAPYDCILVSIDCEEIPVELKSQLKDGGRMVISLRGSIWLVQKKGSEMLTEEYRGFSFTPSVRQGEWA